MKNCLKKIRMEEHNKTPMEFAIFLGINYSTYIGWEKGTSQPPLETAIRIARKLEKKVEDIWYIY